MNPIAWAAGLALGAAVVAAGCSLGNPGNTAPPGGNVIGPRPISWVYSTLNSVDAVLEINTVQSRVTNQPILGVPAGPRSVAIDPRGRNEYLYVVGERGDAVGVVDRRTRQMNRSISVGDAPWGIAVEPNGRKAFVSNQADDTVSVIDLTNQVVVQTVQLTTTTSNQPGQPTASRFQPRGIVTNAAGTRVYVVGRNGQVALLEGNPALQQPNYSVTGSVFLSGSRDPLNIAVATTGQNQETAFVTDPQANRVFGFGPQPGATAQSQDITGGPTGVALSPRVGGGAPDRLYVTTMQNNGLVALSVPDMGQIEAVSVEGRGPVAVAVSPLGDKVWVSLSESNTIAEFDRVGARLGRPVSYNIQQLDQRFIAPTGDLALGGFLTQ